VFFKTYLGKCSGIHHKLFPSLVSQGRKSQRGFSNMHNENHITRTQANLEGSSPQPPNTRRHFFRFASDREPSFDFTAKEREDGPGPTRFAHLPGFEKQSNKTHIVISYTHEATSKVLLYIPNYLETSTNCRRCLQLIKISQQDHV